MSKSKPAVILTALLTLCAAAAFLATSRAADDPAHAAKVPENTGKTQPAQPKPPAAGAPQVPEESASVRDDPTIAPDPKQSADNNVSFPTDI